MILMYSRFRRKNNDLIVKKPSEDVIKAHNEAEIIIKENNIDRFLLNIFLDKKGINRFNTRPSLINEFLSSNWFLNLDLKCLLQINSESKRIHTNVYLKSKELIFKEAINKIDDIIVNFDSITDCSIDDKKCLLICGDSSYKVMFSNKNLAKLFFDYLSKNIE